MDISLVDNIEDDEIIDPELGGDIETSSQDEVNTVITREHFKMDSLFIVIYEEDDELIDKLLVVDGENLEQDKVLLKDENGNDEMLYFDTNDTLIMENSFYSINDIMEVEELNDDIEKVELTMIKEMYPDIEIEVEEIKDKKYSIIEKRNSLITELITLYKAYDNDLLIYHITDTVDLLMGLYSSEEIQLDNSDAHVFLQKIIQKGIYEIPKWIIPIINNKKKIYKQDKEEIELSDDIIIQKFEDELVEKFNLLTTLEDNHYEKFASIVHTYNPYQSDNKLNIPYHGHYVRDCKEPCGGLNGSLLFDMNQTKNSLEIPVKKDDKNVSEIVSQKEQLSISGFYALPHTFLDITMEKDTLSMHELYFLSDFKYSSVLFKDRIKDRIIENIINLTTTNGGDNLKENIHSFIVEDRDITNEDLSNILKENLPGYTNLLDSIPKDIQNVIYNYSDFKRAYLSYNLDYGLLNKDNRLIVNELIKKNIKSYLDTYNRSVKRKVVKKLKKKKSILSTKEKIQLCRTFIMGLHVVHIRNHYLKKFINAFSREPKIHEDQNYLYERNSEDKLLCKHYLYEIQSHKDPESLNTLKSIYGGEVSDGIISCKVCKEFICHEDFSLLEGFSDGAPTSSRAVLDTSKDALNELNEDQIRVKKRIQKISSVFGVQLNNHDKQTIIEYYDLFNDETFINERYNVTGAYKGHPEYKKIKDSYNFIKPAKSKQDKIKNIKNKELLNRDLSPFKEYLLNSNEIFIHSFFILFFIQTSIPSYPINPSLSINLWNFEGMESWEEINQDITSKIVIDTISVVKKILHKMISLNSKDKFWKNVKKLLNEEGEYKGLPSFHNQFLNVTSYLLKNDQIRKKLREYYLFKKENVKESYLNEYWITYKPLFDNENVLMINKKVNDEFLDIQEFLLKNGQGYVYENISSIRSFKDAYETPRFKQLKIPFSEIMKNESYERLFNYAVHLHGKSPSIPLINLLINQFIRTITDSNVEAMLGKIGWSPKGLKIIDYSKFRHLFTKEITEYFKSKTPEDRSSVDIYIHFNINNWNGMLLNGNSKRNYSYIPPVVFPNETFEDLLKVDVDKEEREGITKNFINELFNRYCLDENEEINEKYEIDRFIYNLVDDPNIEKTKLCHKAIPKTKENFYRLLDYKRQSSKLPLPKIIQYENTIEKLFRKFIKDNNLLKENADESYIIFRTLNDFTEETPEKEYRILFNDMFTHNSFMINKIQGFFHNNSLLDKEQLDRYRYSFGRNVDSMSILLNKMLESTEKIPSMITHLFHILSRLSNHQMVETGVCFHNDIPKEWKLSDTNKDHLKVFLENNEFLLHNDIFIVQKDKSDIGFYHYQKENKYTIYIQGLFQYIKQFYQKDYHILKGKDRSQFTDEYSNIMNRFTFLFIFCKIINYIELLNDNESSVSVHANTLFSSLEEQEHLEHSESIKICTTLSFDILTDLLESFSDPLWIYQSGNISEKLSQQKEREKQSILDSIEHKTDDERHVMIHTQKCGLSTYFTKAEEENSSHIQTESYKLKTNDERAETAKELFSQNEVELEVIEQMGINSSNLQPGFSGEEEENYIPEDEDREGEGLDDFDDSGDYREG